MSYLSLPFINRVIKMDCPSAGHKVIYSAFFPKIPYLGFAIKQRIDRHSCFLRVFVCGPQTGVSGSYGGHNCA